MPALFQIITQKTENKVQFLFSFLLPELLPCKQNIVSKLKISSDLLAIERAKYYDFSEISFHICVTTEKARRTNDK